MMRRALAVIVVLAIAAAEGLWIVTAPRLLAAAALPQHTADIGNGRRVFFAGGCAGCHAAEGATGDARFLLGGGQALVTAFGTFHVPNISSDKGDGIGGWTDLQFADALKRGVSPEGEHYYPAFPYASYAHLSLEDVADLRAFLATLPAVPGRAPEHELKFPYNIRRTVGIWKLLYLDPRPVVALASPSASVARGQYLVEGPGHCGECHTPRDAMGGMQKALWLAGAPNPSGKGRIPNITPHPDGIADWSESDLVQAFKTGFTPDFDTLGGQMAEVQRNLAELPDEDLAAIAAYLKAIPPHPNPAGAKPARPAG